MSEESREPLAGRRLLEVGDLFLPMEERFRRAVKRMRSGERRISLREMQKTVVQDATEYLAGVVEQDDDSSPFARIILPPRSGKTVIAASLISKSGLCSVFLVPKRVLADQTAKEFEKFLPGVPVSVYTGETAELARNGVIISTYQKLLADLKRNKVPKEILRAALVFCDEGHRAMTKKRQLLLTHAFDRGAVRIALTATPDYSEDRVLAEHFPDLIHEITIQEGVDLKLLSPVRAFAAEVNVDASEVRVFTHGEYEQEALGLVMSRMPMLKAAQMIRYAAEHRSTPTLITCTTRAQAMSLFEYLAEHRPEGTPCPAPILGDMDKKMRRQFLRYFEEGKLDTLITVGVLIEGWNAPKCKLLIDLAPSLSWVRSAQKYARVMTPHEDMVAKIYVLQPAGLLQPPILPMDVFGPGVQEMLVEEEPMTSDAFPGSGGHRGRKLQNAWQRMLDAGIPVRSVRAKLRILEEFRIGRIRLDRKNAARVRKIVQRSMPGRQILHTRRFGEFTGVRFRISGITINGSQLLRSLGFQSTYGGYRAFVAKYFPDDYSETMLHGDNPWYYRKRAGLAGSTSEFHTIPLEEMEESSADRFEREFYSPPSTRKQKDAASDGLAAATGTMPEAPGELHDRQALEECLSRCLERLDHTHSRVLKWRYGLEGESILTLREIGDRFHLSQERIRQIEVQALRELRLNGAFGDLLESDSTDFRGLRGHMAQAEAEKRFRRYRPPVFRPRPGWKVAVSYRLPMAHGWGYDLDELGSFCEAWDISLSLMFETEGRRQRLEIRDVGELHRSPGFTTFKMVWYELGRVYVNVERDDQQLTLVHPAPRSRR